MKHLFCLPSSIRPHISYVSHLSPWHIDVETMAQSFAIEEHMEFTQDEEGTKAMFARERRCRERYNCCVAEDAVMPKGKFFEEENN